MKRSLLIVCLVALLASCSDRPSPAAKGSPSTPSTSSRVVALNSSELVAGQTTFNTIRFVRVDGTEIRTFKLPKDSTPPTAGGDRVFFVVDGEVHSVDASGSSVNHGKFMDEEPAFTKLVVSPDGKRWAWTIEKRHQDDSITSKLFIAGEGSDKAKVLLEETSTVQTVAIPVLWTAAGLVVIDMPEGIGGLIFFADTYWGRSRLVDPDTGKSTTLTHKADECPLNDVSSDRSWTCVRKLGHGGGSVGTATKGTVVLHRPGSAEVELNIEQAALQVGNAVISPRGDRVAVGIYTGTRADESYSLSTIVFDVAMHSQTTASSDDTVPAAWLPDGSLVLVGADFARPKGCSLLKPDGSTVNLGDGRFIGFLDAKGSVPAR